MKHSRIGAFAIAIAISASSFPRFASASDAISIKKGSVLNSIPLLITNNKAAAAEVDVFNIPSPPGEPGFCISPGIDWLAVRNKSNSQRIVANIKIESIPKAYSLNAANGKSYLVNSPTFKEVVLGPGEERRITCAKTPAVEPSVTQTIEVVGGYYLPPGMNIVENEAPAEQSLVKYIRTDTPGGACSPVGDPPSRLIAIHINPAIK